MLKLFKTYVGGIIILAFVLISAGIVYASVDFYRVDAGTEVSLDPIYTGISGCDAIDNNSSVDYFVPFNTQTEWDSFSNNLPSNVTISASGGGYIYNGNNATCAGSGCTPSTPVLCSTISSPSEGTICRDNQDFDRDSLYVVNAIQVYSCGFTNTHGCSITGPVDYIGWDTCGGGIENTGMDFCDEVTTGSGSCIDDIAYTEGGEGCGGTEDYEHWARLDYSC